MGQQDPLNHAPDTRLFPQFGDLRDMVAAEVRGLTDHQLDWRSDRWEWSKWSIRQQVSHIANIVPAWLLGRWQDQLFPEGISELGDLADYAPSSAGPWLDESRYRAIADLMENLDQGLRLAQYVLARETVDSLRRKEVPRPDTPPHWRQFIRAHPSGVRWHPTEPNFSYMTLEATFRHVYFESITHLYNIQRLKRAQGLRSVTNIPFEGYWALSDWDRSEP